MHLKPTYGCKDLKSEKGQGAFYPLLFPGTEGGASAGDRDRMHKIQNGRHEVEIRPAAVGIANEGLLEGKEYDMILHASMLESRERGTKYDHETCTAKI